LLGILHCERQYKLELLEQKNYLMLITNNAKPMTAKHKQCFCSLKVLQVLSIYFD
jgi:hypothetical protein